MSTHLSVGLLNYENGGRISPGQYDFTKLQTAFAGVEEAPALILLNEAKEWNLWGHLALHGAANALSEYLGRPYVGELGAGKRGPASTPALIYDPQIVRVDSWGDAHESVHPDKKNFLNAHVSGRAAAKFRVIAQHWSPNSGDARLEEAREISGYAKGVPTLLGGDLNGTASGPHFPRMDWTLATDELRLKKAIQLPDGTFGADTRAVDFLIGPWDESSGSRMARKIGWHALAELAQTRGTPAELAFLPTVNRGIDRGGGLLIDWLLVNEAWKDGLVPNTYTVHVPLSENPEDYPSDHRLVTATLDI